MKMMKIAVLSLAAALTPAAAMAYVGPGAGLSAIGSVLSFLGVVVLLIAGFVWYPVKRLIRSLRSGRKDGGADEGASGEAAEN